MDWIRLGVKLEHFESALSVHCNNVLLFFNSFKSEAQPLVFLFYFIKKKSNKFATAMYVQPLGCIVNSLVIGARLKKAA
jgi:hypothetical protein